LGVQAYRDPAGRTPGAENVKKSYNPFSEETEDLKGRLWYLTLAVLCLFGLLLLRLWYLQVIRGHEYRVQSESNRTRVEDILPPRGIIMDRNGNILVENYPAYQMAVIREHVTDGDELARRLAYLLGMPTPGVEERLREASRKPAFRPTVVFSDLTQTNLVDLETHRYELPGVVIQVKPRRRYLYDRTASHVIGYLGEVTSRQLEMPEYKDHRMGDQAGQSGVEKHWERDLHGRRGRVLVEVDASGRVLKVLQKNNPVPGDNLQLTIDVKLQQAAQQAMEGKAGAVVALDPNSGEILAMVSSPTYSQNDFVEGIDAEKWKGLINDPLHPLENRAVSGQYPPGSTYKIVAAAAALEEGVVTPDTIIHCAGGYPFGDRVFHCWNKGGHGAVNMRRAIKESCDIYFYEVGRRLGVDRLAKYSRAFGLGAKAGLGLGTEKPGLVPTKAWKKERFKVPWQAGETLSVVIGQGYNQATPLQMAQVVAIAANGGTLYKSHIVKRITNSDGEVVREVRPEIVRNLNLSPSTVKIIQEGLMAVVNEPEEPPAEPAWMTW
jgi:penicillin-binding protein 2